MCIYFLISVQSMVNQRLSHSNVMSFNLQEMAAKSTSDYNQLSLKKSNNYITYNKCIWLLFQSKQINGEFAVSRVFVQIFKTLNSNSTDANFVVQHFGVNQKKILIHDNGFMEVQDVKQENLQYFCQIFCLISNPTVAYFGG